MKYYAGIGSRETPAEIQTKMTEIAKRLSRLPYCLRSGGADGADAAFELGATHKQIFLPWNGFNGKKADGVNYLVPEFNSYHTNKYHPKPSALSDGALRLMSRNAYQVLGPALNDPVDFVLCWTKDGAASGGTGQAIRIARAYSIPVFNLNGSGFEQLSMHIKMLQISLRGDDDATP
jgi:hypothetical protein